MYFRLLTHLYWSGKNVELCCLKVGRERFLQTLPKEKRSYAVILNHFHLLNRDVSNINGI